MVVEWTSGNLPWHRFKGGNRDEVRAMKENIRSRDSKSQEHFLR